MRGTHFAKGRCIGRQRTPLVPNKGQRLAHRPTAVRHTRNSQIVLYDIAAKTAKPADNKQFDYSIGGVQWSTDGSHLVFGAQDRVYSSVFTYDIASGRYNRLTSEMMVRAPSFSKDGMKVAFAMDSPKSPADVFVTDASFSSPRRVTNTNPQLAGFSLGETEVITWKSADGTSIEGVLHKPADFVAGRRYPLLVLIHGGPTGISRTTPLGTYVYPVPIWLAKGALVLEPNYRGSAGYGERFRSLNVRNLGVGDAWDVVSGVDHLVAQGLVDRDRVGTMGWSQGGYISAFLATHDSARFKVASVGAGISNWTTYYVNTDIHPFTRQYLRATPWDDPDVYAKTSPMTYITRARTPTLIQHGELDRRVPIPNAYELYQGLQDRGVPTRLVVYKGFGHGLTKPKAQRAAMEHNLEWFDVHLFGPPAGATSGGR